MQLDLHIIGEQSISVTFRTEEWKQIEEFRRYDVSTFGRFRSRGTGKTFVPYRSENGYARINLTKDGKLHNCLAHRVVAKTFLLNPDNLPYVDHIDGDRMNCRVENLRWASYSQNAKNNKSARKR